MPVVALAILGAITTICLGIFIFLCTRKRIRPAECTACTNGIVVGPSNINYAGHHIPLVCYRVQEKEYRVAGPDFESGSSAPNARCNITDRLDPPRHLVVPSIPVHSDRVTNEQLYAVSPLSQLYPVGSELPVWYNPNEPEMAYVLRPVHGGLMGKIVLGVLTICFGISFAILAVVVLG